MGVEHGIGNKKYSKGIFKNVKELKRAEYRVTFTIFLMFHIAKRLYTLIFWIICNKFEDNFVFACNLPGKIPFSQTISSPNSLKYSKYLLSGL